MEFWSEQDHGSDSIEGALRRAGLQDIQQLDQSARFLE